MTDMLFDTWVFGRANGGTTWHAVKRSEPRSVPGTIFDGGYVVGSLCGARGTGGLLIATNDRFATATDRNVCTTCVRRWTARHAESIPGWTKSCRSCNQDKPINQFHVDRRTRDQLSTTCLDCTEANARTIREAERLARSEADRQSALEEAHRSHRQRLAALTRWQQEPDLPSYLCTHGHALEASTGARLGQFRWADTLWPTEQWTCPCGATAVEVDWRGLFLTLEAMDVVAAAAASSLPPVHVDGIAS